MAGEPTREYTYRVDLDGVIWHDDSPTDVPQLYAAFFRTLESTEDGRLFAVCQGETCWLEPADTVFVVDSIREEPAHADPETGPERVTLLLAGGVEDPLDPATLYVGAENVLYAKARNGEIPVRFSRKAYYQLGRYVTEVDGSFGIRVDGTFYRLVTGVTAEAETIE